VLYHGHPIAAVAATSPSRAAEARDLIAVDYEPLPAVLDARHAMQADAPILLDDLRTDELGARGDAPTNIARHLQHQRGDLEVGFRAAAVTIERRFRTTPVHQGYLEPQSTTALWASDGRLTIWCSTDGSFGVREEVATLLQIPTERIRVIPLEIGGSFGGRGLYLEPVAALLSKQSGHRPVKMTLSRAEVLSGTGPSPGAYLCIEMGADSSGRITAAQARLVYEAGAYPWSTVGAGVNIAFAPYRIEHLQIDGYDVLVNRPKTGSYRGLGTTIVVSAIEMVVDELAEKLGIDPLAFRALNGVREGDRQPDGRLYRSIGYLETVEAARRHPHYSAPLKGPHQGRGVSTAVLPNWGGRSSARASVHPDGAVELTIGSVDLSGTRTTLAMQLAETLGIPVEAVDPQVADTDGVGYTDGSFGSRTTFASGWAMYELGQRLRRELIGRAARLWAVAPCAVSFDAGTFSTRNRRLTFKELAARLEETGSPVTAEASVDPAAYGHGGATHIADVEVDPETGKVEILRYTAVQDVGRAIHPAYVEGQIQGGIVQGIGWALHEEYVYDDEGHLLNSSLLDYRMPTCLDVPMIDPVLVEVPHPGHPYGVRGVGELPILPVPAAIANAIYRAVGARLSRLPMSPPTILKALETTGESPE